MSGATSKCSGTDGAKFPMVDVGQVPVSGAAQGAVSCLEIFLFRSVSNVAWVNLQQLVPRIPFVARQLAA